MSSPNMAANFSVHPDWVGVQKQEKMIRQEFNVNRTAIRETRDRITMLRCQSCNRLEEDIGAPLKRCQNCKIAWYCSVECQKKDWKAGHKRICAPSDFGIQKYLGAIMANILLRTPLMLAIILLLELQKLGPKDFDRFFCIHLHLAFEPASLETFFRLLLGENPNSIKSELPGNKIPSILQVNAISTLPPGVEPTQQSKDQWKELREKCGDSEGFVIVAEAGLKEGPNSGATLSAFQIPFDLVKEARKAAPLDVVSPLKGITQIPLTFYNALSMFNTSIRMDHKDRFKMRRKDTDAEELRVMANVGRGVINGTKEEILRDKLYSDDRYKEAALDSDEFPQLLPLFDPSIRSIKIR